MSGNRLLTHHGDGSATLYLPEGMEVHATGGGVLTCSRYYGGIAVRTSDDGLSWLAADHHGTASHVIAADTLTVVTRRSDPYGNPRGPVTGGTWPDDKGFLGKPADPATGLTHLGAREYDPTLGRFISVDPVMDLTDPQQIHGYTYSNNNPVTWDDPSGLKFCIDTDCKRTATPPKPKKPSSGGTGSSGGGNRGGGGTGSSGGGNRGGGGSSSRGGSGSSSGGGSSDGGKRSGSGSSNLERKKRTHSSYSEQKLCRLAGTNGSCTNTNRGDGSKPAESDNGSRSNPVFGRIGDVASWISSALSFIPGFICSVCSAVSLGFGAVAALAYLLADGGLTGRVIHAIVSSIGGALLGAAGKAAIGPIVKKLGGEMLHLRRHLREAGDRVLRYVPTSMRAKVDWVVSGVEGMINSANTLLGSMAIES